MPPAAWTLWRTGRIDRGRVGFSIPGVGQAKGTSLKNPVTGEVHRVAIVLEEGFIWTRGDCGQGTFDVEAEGIHFQFEDSNWIYYDFDWSNQE